MDDYLKEIIAWANQQWRDSIGFWLACKLLTERDCLDPKYTEIANKQPPGIKTLIDWIWTNYRNTPTLILDMAFSILMDVAQDYNQTQKETP